MRGIEAVIGPPDKNGLRTVKLTKRKQREIKNLLSTCDKWLADFKKLEKASPPGFYGRSPRGHQPPKRRGK